MLLASFGRHVPEWFTPVITISLIAFFFWLSYREVKTMEANAEKCGN